MTAITARRLPAYGRELRANLDAGRLPALGGGAVAVCVGWPAQCALAHVVCPRDDRPANGWDFSFLAGIDAIVTLRKELGRDIPALIVSGDTRGDACAEVHAAAFRMLAKPVVAAVLKAAAEAALAGPTYPEKGGPA